MCVMPPALLQIYMTFLCAEAKTTGHIYDDVLQKVTFSQFYDKLDIYLERQNIASLK